MKITRTINDQNYVFELTETELRQAYLEQEKIYHDEDVINQYEDAEDQKCTWSKEKIRRVAENAIEKINNNDYYWDIYWDAFSNAITEELSRNENNKIIK